MYSIKHISFIITLLLFIGCKQHKNNETKESSASSFTWVKLKYAKGFNIKQFKNYKEITVTSAFPNSNKSYRYILVNDKKNSPINANYQQLIKIPVSRLIVTSTTNIPILEYLGVDTCLVGFPNTKYITSEKTRARAKQGKIMDLNNDLDINFEHLISLKPDLVIGFSVNGNDKVLNQINNFNIPVVLDGAWTEEHPLGRAEWIKFIAAFFNKEQQADSIFNTIELQYLEAKAVAQHATTIPTVFSGMMFNGSWDIPGGKSYMATYFKDANTQYLWKNNTDTGSLQLNFENVLQTAKHVNYWIGIGAYANKQQMQSDNNNYKLFDAFTQNKIYSYKQDHGIPFYELGVLRPDLILKDIISITHPELLKNYNLHFFKPLK